MLQVLGLQAAALGELRVCAAPGERRHALLLWRRFLLGSEGGTHFQFPTWEKVSNLSESTLANVQGELQLLRLNPQGFYVTSRLRVNHFAEEEYGLPQMA